MMIREEEVVYVESHYRQLIGFKVVDIAFSEDPDGGELWPVLIMAKGSKRLHASVACDPEGNGAGHLHIDEATR